MSTRVMPDNPNRLRIAFLTNIPTTATNAGGSVHVLQVAKRLIGRGHQLYTNLQCETEPFVAFSERDFIRRGNEIDLFYIRIHGSAANDELTLLRRANAAAPCVWEINAPLEELRTMGGSETELRSAMRRRRELAGMVDAAVCVSEEMEEYARTELGIGKTFVIPNGSDAEMFTPAKRDASVYGTRKYTILWSGSPKYGWQGLRTVQAFAGRLKERGVDDIMLMVTADGASADNLHYLGHVPYSDMPRYMASADAGLCIYEPIGFYRQFYFSPLKLYDYMASGIPVIGTNEGQIRLVIREHRNGFLTDNTLDDLVEKSLCLKNSPDTVRAMGFRGREAVLQKYNWDHIVSATEEVFAELLAGPATAPFGASRGAGIRVLSRYGKPALYLYLYRNILRGTVKKFRNIVKRAGKKLLSPMTIRKRINRWLHER